MSKRMMQELRKEKVRKRDRKRETGIQERQNI
jgi:hypothetical protein